MKSRTKVISLQALLALFVLLFIQSWAMNSHCEPGETECRFPCVVEVLTKSESARSTLGFTQGETILIDRYVDRWFNESIGPQSEADLCLFFQPPEQILEIKCDEIEIKKVGEPNHEFAKFLSSKGVLLKAHPLKNNYFVSTSDDGHHKFERWFGNFAWDILTTRGGQIYQGTGTSLQDHFSFGEKVFSPVSGKIANIVRDRFDRPVVLDLENAPPIPDNEKTPNYILIQVHGNLFFEIVHFKKNSIPKNLKIGDTVNTGDYLGEIGNSGVSYIPHLHFTSYYKNTKGRFMSIPTLIHSPENPDHAIQPPTGTRFRFCESLFKN